MPDLSDLADVLVGCRVVTRAQWNEAARVAGDDLDELLAAVAAEKPHWWGAQTPAPPGLTDYQRAVIRDRFDSDDLDALRRDLALNQFVLLDKLGQGGQGEVYRARQLNPPRFAAVKTLVRDTDVRRRRFEREARAMMKVQHPAVARFYLYERVRDAHGEPTDEYVIAMEFVNGTPLHRLVHKAGPVPWPFAVHWVVGLLGGLAEIHRSGFVHGDVKPENIMVLGPAPGPRVTPEQTAAKLLDFGAAKQLDAADPDQEGPARTFVGTPEYSPPEQWLGQLQPASDLYSLGGALFHMLAGKSPFQLARRDPIAYRTAHTSGEIPDLRLVDPDVPHELHLLFRRMMAKDPADRGTAEELAGEFRKLMPGTAPARTPPPKPAAPKPTGPRPAPAVTPPPAKVAALKQAAAMAAKPAEPVNPLYRLVDGVLGVFEWVFLPGHSRPRAGTELGVGERVAALLRRPLVLLLILTLVGVLVYVSR